MRASMGAGAAGCPRFGQGTSLSAGAVLSARRLVHITGLEQLGATIKLEEGYVRPPSKDVLKGRIS